MTDPLYGIEVPPELRDLTLRHQTHIGELVTQLRTVGLDDAAIEAAVDQLIGTYRAQLIDAVKAMGGHGA